MATGACGIDCSVCGLHVNGLCSTCGGGTTQAAREKLDAQHTLLGMGCSILECAAGRKLDFCSRDCLDFPCSLFTRGPYPFSEGFLHMQKRRRMQSDQDKSTDPKWPREADEFWDMLLARNPAEVCRDAEVAPLDRGGYNVKCLNENWIVELETRSIKKAYGQAAGDWDRLMPFFILAYLVKADQSRPSGRMVSPRDIMPGLNYFQGMHSLDAKPLEEFFGQDAALFARAAGALGADPTGQGDASMRLWLFPKLPVEFIFWAADEDFPSRATVLLDDQSRFLYPVNVIYKAVNLLVKRLVFTAKNL